MKLLRQDWKKGEVKLKVEHADDLWYLSLIIEPGDEVRTSTERKIKIGDTTTDRNVKVVRKSVTITLRAEKTEFSASWLRVSGSIVDGPEDVPRGVHHTVNVEPGSMLRLTKKEWLHYQRERLKEAEIGRAHV